MTDAFTHWLVDAIADLARLDHHPGLETMVGALGIGSLAMATLQYRLQAEHGIVAPLEDLTRNQTLGALADRLAALRFVEDMG